MNKIPDRYLEGNVIGFREKTQFHIIPSFSGEYEFLELTVRNGGPEEVVKIYRDCDENFINLKKDLDNEELYVKANVKSHREPYPVLCLPPLGALEGQKEEWVADISILDKKNGNLVRKYFVISKKEPISYGTTKLSRIKVEDSLDQNLHPSSSTS